MSGFAAIPMLGRTDIPGCVLEGGCIAWWNDGAERLFGVQAARAVGLDWHDVIGIEDRARECGVCRAAALLASGHPAIPTKLMLRAGGIPRMLTVVPLPLEPRGSDPLAILFVDVRVIVQAHPSMTGTERIGVGTPGLGLQTLTAREWETLTYLADGLDSQGIATCMGVSYATARNHIQRVLTKLGVHSRAQAVRLYYAATSSGE